MNSRVFVLEPTEFDITVASEWGEVVYLYQHHSRRPAPTTGGFPRSVLLRMSELQFDPSTDLVVLSGQMIALVVLTATLVAEYGSIKCLRFSSTSDRYVPFPLGQKVSIC